MGLQYKILLFTLLGVANILSAQTDFNKYKYIIVPEQYSFLREADQYQLNSLTKFLFEKYGFEALMENEAKPLDLKAKPCLALRANVYNESSFLTIKLKFDLRDCHERVVYSSPEGKSREKDFAKGYKLALRDAFESLSSINYQYQPEEEVSNDNVASGTVEQYTNKDGSEPLETNFLTAVAINNGYILKDANNNIVMTLYFSGATDVFIVKGKEGIVFKRDSTWVLSENDGQSLTNKIINISF